jgi:hypothetical protein
MAAKRHCLLHEERKRGLDSLGLRIRRQAGQHFDEVRVLSAGKDVLPPISAQQAGLEIVPLLR